MKYNGKEVTSDFISQIMSRAFKNTDEIYPSAKEVYAVLQAAEEVFAESQPKTELNSELERIIANLDAAQQEYNPHIDRIIEDLTNLKEAQHGEG